MLAADQDRRLISLFGKRCAAEATITLTGRLLDFDGLGKRSTSLRTELFFPLALPVGMERSVDFTFHSVTVILPKLSL